jgi:hypothetical protein
MRQLWVMALLAFASAASYSAEPANAADPRAAIAKKVPGAKIEDVRPSHRGCALRLQWRFV